MTRKQHSCELIETSVLFASNICRTTDTSFVDNPPTSTKAMPKFATPARASHIASRGRPAGRGGAARGLPRGARGSGLARAAKGRGVR